MVDYDAGRVFLQVVPSFAGIQRRIGAEARKWGADAGKDFQQGFDREVGQRTTKQSVGPTPMQSRRQGTDAGGAFADGFRRRVEQALRSLPPVPIGVATNEADQKLRDLRIDLERLSGQTVGVDIDSAAAMGELGRIQAELNKLSAETPNVQVRADIAAASAQLASVHRQANALDRDDVTIDVDTRGGAGALALLTSNGAAAHRSLSGVALAGALLGPAIIPVAGAAAVAIAGIGGAAIAAASGIGVLALGFSGIGDAVKALGEVQTNAARDAEAASARQASSAAAVASAQRSVASAEASLTNARANAAVAAESAAQRVTDAQKRVVDAQRDTAEAVEDAQRRIDDATEGLARAQESAAESVEAAARRVADAQRAVEDAAEAAARAVEGASKRVIDAQERLDDAIEGAGRANAAAARRVEDAQRRASDAAERSARAVVDALARRERAERSLADAQRDALEAQESLNEAREAAQDDIEDLSLAVRQGAIDEQQAVMAIAEARNRLANLGGSRDITVDQRFTGQLVLNDETRALTEREQEKARLALEEAELGLERIQLANERLAEEQARTAAQGVEGSDRVIAAQRRLENATRRVADAERAVGDAFESVDEARRRQTRDNADAQRDLADAVENRARVEENSAERVIDAQEALTEATEDRVRAEESAARRVADARQRLTDATEAQSRVQRDAARQVEDAQRRVADAQEALTDAQANGAERVIAAQAAVAAAVAASAEQQRQSVFSVEQAQRSLEGSQAALAEALRRTGDEGSASMRKLEDAMAGLSPAGVAFAQFLHGLRPVLDQFQAAAQTGLLPGVQAGIEALLTRKDEMLAFVGDLATTMGLIAQRTGEAFAGPAWENFFDYLSRTAAPTLYTLAEAFGGIALGIANLIVAFEPVQEMFITGFANMAKTFADWSAGLAENKGFQQFLDYLQEVAPLVMDTFGSLFRALGNIAVGLAPIGEAVLRVIGHVADFIAELNPEVITAFAMGVMAFIVGFQVAAAVLAVVAIPIAAKIGLVFAAVGVLTASVITLYNESKTFRGIVNAVWESVSAAVSFAWTSVLKPTFAAFERFMVETLAPALIWLWKDIAEPAFVTIGTIVSYAWTGVIKPALAAFDTLVRDVLGPTVMWLWHEIIRPAFEGATETISGTWATVQPILQRFGDFMEGTVAPAFSRGIDAIGAAFGRIKALAATPVNFVIETVYMGGIKPVFDRIASVVGMDALPVAQPIRFASGGMMPGYTPGRDIHRFYSPTAGMLELSGGEPILRPEAGRVLGRSWVDGVNAAARAGGTGGVRRYLGGYADGGILSFHEGGIFHSARHGIADTAALVREGVKSAISATGRFVLGGLRSAAEKALAPVRQSLSGIGGGRLSAVAGGLANRAIDGLLGFAGKRDESASLEGGVFGRYSKGWPRAIFGRVSANTAAAVRFVRDTFGIGNIGVLGNRPNRSDHPMGKAFDAMIANWRAPAGIAKGNQIASWLVDNPKAFGTKYVIWRDRINSGSGWRPYVHPSGNTTNPTLAHRDHVHASLFDSGGRLQPGLSTVMNATGRSELVLNPDQEGALAQALRERTRGGDGGGIGDVYLDGKLVGKHVAPGVMSFTGLDRVTSTARAR